MRYSRCWQSLFLCCLSLDTLACSAEPASEAASDIAVELRGVVQSERAIAPAGVEAVVVWGHPRQDASRRPYTVATRAAVSGAFPADFALTLKGRPPESALEESGASNRGDSIDIRRAFGHVVAVDSALVRENDDGSVDIRDALLGTTDVVGANFETEHFELFYFERAERRDDRSELPEGYSAVLGITTPGYHLLHERRGELKKRCTAAEVDACHRSYEFLDSALPPERRPGYSAEEVAAACGGLWQVSGVTYVLPAETSLHITIPTERLVWTADGAPRGYDAARVPTCASAR